jgi:hypothetical protein
MLAAAGVLAALLPHIAVAEPVGLSSPQALSADGHSTHDELLADQRDADNLNELNIIGAAEGVPLPTQADMLARYAQWERRVAAGNRARWEEQIRQHRLARSATGKRQLQNVKNWDLDILGDLPVDNLTSVLDQPAAVQIATGRTNAPARCEDPLASNAGTNTSCTYECTSLTDQYFPGEDADTTCFIFDPDTNQWPHAEFMATKSTKLLWSIFVDESPATEPIGFMVGAGPVCSNVTVQTSSLSPDAEDSVEVICLLEGVHEHVHEHSSQAAVITVDSGARVLANVTQAVAGDTSLFTNGECEDILFRFDATDGDSDVVWTLNDAGHNGPWTITSSFSSFDRDEHVVCLFDNNFTLTRPANSNWVGTVTVATYVEDNTIRLNNHGNYIVHGTEINGVPSTLDARLQSGSLPASQCHQDQFYDRCVAEAGGADGLGISTANFVVRYVRWTGLKAPLDPYAPARMHSMRAPVRLGGGFYFIGGWGSSITFDHCVFDHMLASSGAGFYIDGEMDECGSLSHSCSCHHFLPLLLLSMMITMLSLVP